MMQILVLKAKSRYAINYLFYIITEHYCFLFILKASGYSIAPITCAAAGGVIFGPIGAIAGFKLSTGIISALGASAASYTLAKFVQKKHEIQSKHDLEVIDKRE